MEQLPRHIGIIMDGNGRWAKSKFRPRTYGHIKGARVAKRMITHCAKLGVPYLTLFAFSTENWLRPPAEVNFLMGLLRRQLHREADNLVKENIRFTTIGDLNQLPSDLINAVKTVQEKTAGNTGMQLAFALNYGARTELTAAVKSIALRVKDGELDPSQIDESTVSSHLQSFPMPDPDLIVRTSGELRLSNFLLWQSAYSELYFTKTVWPEFTEKDLDLAISEFQKRGRRFGQVSEDVRTQL
jgi:undecaprenyl diphosphate synthase